MIFNSVYETLQKNNTPKWVQNALSRGKVRYTNRKIVNKQGTYRIT